ncbi:MAG: hypothetical protein E7254_02080 [Lachnospiraceae bacterium]|nr:hypothetical protein [Lachnospiraceae bacterium]
MSKSPKFMVLHLMELIYSVILIAFVIILIVFLFNYFKKSDTKKSKESMYIPGVYTSQISLGNSSFEIKMVFDENHINDLTINNVSDSVSAMYPLLLPTFDEITKQILKNNSTETVSCPDSSRYTGQLLLNHISALEESAKNH